jgi:hypothetical protein
MAVKKKLVGKSVDANPRPSKLVKIISLFYTQRCKEVCCFPHVTVRQQ